MPTGGESLKGVELLVWIVLVIWKYLIRAFFCVPFSIFRMFLVNRGMGTGMMVFSFGSCFLGEKVGKFGKKEFIPSHLTLAWKMGGAGVSKLMHWNHFWICHLFFALVKYLLVCFTYHFYGHNVLSCRNAFIRDIYDFITWKITYANGSIHFLRYIHLTLDCLRVSITYVM